MIFSDASEIILIGRLHLLSKKSFTLPLFKIFLMNIDILPYLSAIKDVDFL